MVEYLFDENLSHFYANSINELEKSRGKYIVRSTKDVLRPSASDKEILKYALSQKHTCIIVAQDKDFKKRKLFDLIIKSNNVGLILINFPKGHKFWDQIRMIYKHWVGIRDLININKPPFAFIVKYRKIEKL